MFSQDSNIKKNNPFVIIELQNELALVQTAEEFLLTLDVMWLKVKYSVICRDGVCTTEILR